MKKEKHSGDKISEQTLHEILLDIKYRLNHIEDITADDRATLIKLVKHYIEYNKSLPKNVDCIYDACIKDYLSDIANIINSLSNYKVKINIGEGKGKNYVGSNNPLNVEWIGLEQGIKETYKKLLNE